MNNDHKGTIFLKLVLDTLAVRQYYETCIVNDDGDHTTTSSDDALHQALVQQLGRLLFDLDTELSALDYEVFEEFYTDQVLDESGFELSISGACDEDFLAVEELRCVFEAKALDIFAEVPSLLSRLEPVRAD